jgi:transposase
VADVEADAGYWRARAEGAEARLAMAAAEKAELNARVVELSQQVTLLTEQVATLSGMLFGVSSEKKARDQAGDDHGGAGADAAGQAGDGQRGPGMPKRGQRGPGMPKRGQRRGGAGHGRRDYSHLETEERIIDLEGDERCCAGCGKAFICVGAEDSEQLDWRIKVVRIVWRRRRYQRTCSCPGPVTVCAPPAPKVIPKGLYTAPFLARVLFYKYLLGLPIHRIISMLSAEGAEVASGSLIGALKDVAALVRPWAAAIAARLPQAGHVHADETSWQVFEQVEGKDSSRWWLWTFLTDQVTVFVIDPSRGAKAAATALGIDREVAALEAGRRLVLSSDFYSVYQSLAAIEGVDPLYCWVHIRRYFLRAAAAHPAQLGEWADGWTSRISVLYREHRALPATQPGTPEHTQKLARFHRAFDDLDARRIEQNALAEHMHPSAAKVIATLNREWDGLARHRDLPFLPLDNNRAERALRTPVIGRKNFYGSGAAWAATLAADIWTITATAAQHDLEPLSLLTDYLTVCAQHDGKAPKDLDPFLPWTPSGRARRARDNSGPSP